LLHSSIPSSRTWKVSKLLDFKSLKSMPTASADQGEVITGGLAGVASMFLGVTLNKRQQLSNWEMRPLTEEQALYGGKIIMSYLFCSTH
jgi:predicted membrane GTPase involved in stress response